MKNKKGFTLIELLAVIVVLAIIALIATPIVMNTIKNAKKGAAERTADNYIKQVETAVATERLAGNVLEGEYEITSDGNLCIDKSVSCSDENKIYIEMSGSKPSSGKIAISNGKAEILSKITIGTFDVVYNSTSKKYEATEKGSNSEDDKSTAETLCKAVTVATTGNVPSGNFNYGDEYSCNLGDTDDTKNLTFFVLDKTDTEVSLIMNKNLGDTVAWCSDESLCKTNNAWDNTKGPITANKALEERTTNWNKITDKTKIVLPTGQQIATAGGDTEWNDSAEGNGFSSVKWLYENLNDNKIPYGYWTSTYKVNEDTTSSSRWFVSNSESWIVGYNGALSFCDLNVDTDFGIRPVITISKSNLS